MTAPSLTLRSLQNEETGIDISVPTIQEEEAPLGGTSVLYEIAVLTKLDLFKTRLHKDEDVVQFSVYKAYREVEDLCTKLKKKYPNVELPSVPRTSSIDKLSNKEKITALDKFMKSLAQHAELCRSSIFTHFIGIDSQRFSASSISNVNTISETSSTVLNIAAENKQQSEDEDLSHVFPKVKNMANKAESKVTKSQSGLTQSKNVDLFEEVKLVKDIKTSSDAISSNTPSLFDDFDDESLFSSTPAPKPVAATEPVKSPEVKPRKKEPEKKIEVDDSQIIIKDRKLGDISLFKEQDLGDYITQEEEALFLVSTNIEEKIKKNKLLFSSEDSEPAEPDSDLHEDLDDLLNLNPLPTSPIAAKKPESSAVSANEVKSNSEVNTIAEFEQHPKRPVPLPRKKSLGKCDTDEISIKTRPEVMPRKVFLTKSEVPAKLISSEQEVSKPAKPPPVSAKPAKPLSKGEKPAKPLPLGEKPALAQKPKPPTKALKPSQQKDSKDLDIVNANQSTAIENKTSISSFTDDLNKMDILKYIEQEQKTLESEPSLFD